MRFRTNVQSLFKSKRNNKLVKKRYNDEIYKNCYNKGTNERDIHINEKYSELHKSCVLAPSLIRNLKSFTYVDYNGYNNSGKMLLLKNKLCNNCVHMKKIPFQKLKQIEHNKRSSTSLNESNRYLSKIRIENILSLPIREWANIKVWEVGWGNIKLPQINGIQTVVLNTVFAQLGLSLWHLMLK